MVTSCFNTTMTGVLALDDRHKLSDPLKPFTSLRKMRGQKTSRGGPFPRNDAAVLCDKPEFNSSRDGSRSENFSIREYVSRMRANDIRKNWPFSQKYLQICLDNGRKPLLPPFEHPQSIQDKVKLEAADIPDNASHAKADDSKHSVDTFIIPREGYDERKHTDHGSCKDDIVGAKSMQCLGDQNGGFTTYADMRKGNGCDDTKAKTEGDAEFQEPIAHDNQRPNNTIGGTSEDAQDTKAFARTEEEEEENREPKISCKADSETGTQQSQQSMGQGRIMLPSSEISSKLLRRKRTEKPVSLSDEKNGFLNCSKRPNKMPTFEMRSQENMDSSQKERRKQEQHIDQTNADSGRSENLINSGNIPDGMIHKVCPVCRTFSATSNTALNAHIDHCLDAEPNVEKPVTKFTKHKFKARKKRSMADICAVAPVRKLEDLDCYAQQQLARDTDPCPSLLLLDDSKWHGMTIRRQPRTLHSRVPNRHIECIHPKAKNLINSTDLKMESLPSLPEESRKEIGVLKDNYNGALGTRKSKRAALTNLARTSKRLNCHGFDKIDAKVPRTSAAEHISIEGIPKSSSCDASQLKELAKDEKISSSVNSTSWACFNKQGSSRRKKFKHKLVSLNLAGFGRQLCNSSSRVPINIVEQSQKHLEDSMLSEGTLVQSKVSAGGITSHSSHKEHNLSVIIPSKRTKARETKKDVANNSNSSEEAEDLFTSKRMKNLSKLNFQNTKIMHTDTKGQSSVCETKSPTSEKVQGKQEVSFWYCHSNEEKRHSSHESGEISVNDTFNLQKPERNAVSKVLENETGTSMDGKQSCQLKRAQSKERYSQNKNLLNLNTLNRRNSLQQAVGSPAKNSGLDSSNVVQKRRRHFKCIVGSPKMKKVAHIVHDLMNRKEALRIDDQQTVHDPTLKKESPEFIYDAGSTSNQAYSLKLEDCTNNTEKLLCATETSSLNEEPISGPNLQSGAMPADELLIKTFERSGNVVHAEISGEMEAQFDSTVSTIHEISHERNCMPKSTTVEMMGAASVSLEACVNQPAYQGDAFTRDMDRNVTLSQSSDKEKYPSGICGSFQSQLNSCSEGTLTDLYLDGYLGKKAGSQMNLEEQSLYAKETMNEKLSVSLENQISNERSSTQNEVFSHVSTNVATATKKPLNVSPKSLCLESAIHIETSPDNISSMPLPSIPFSGHSIQLLKAHEVSVVSNETFVLSLDRIDPPVNDASFSEKPLVSCELTTEKSVTTRSGLTGINQVSPAITQRFELARPAPGLSVQRSSSTVTSTNLQSLSQTSFFQGKDKLREDSKLFDTSKVLPSASMCQFVPGCPLPVNSEKRSKAGDVLHAFILNPSSHKHHGISDEVCMSSDNTSGWISEKQNGLKPMIRNSLSSSTFGFMDGMSESCVGNNVCRFSSQPSNIPSYMSTLMSDESGVPFGSNLHPKVCGNQFSESNTVSSSGSDIVTEQSDFSERLPSLVNTNCSREPSVVHIFGSPILRLMGKNVILSSKDDTRSKFVEDTCTESSAALPSQNYPKLLDLRTEAKFGQDAHSQLCQTSDRLRPSDQNILQSFQSRTGKDSNLFQPFEVEERNAGSSWHANDYRKQESTDSENLSHVYAWNSAPSACKSLGVTSFIDGSQYPWLTTRKSCILSESRQNSVSHSPADMFHNLKWQSCSSVLPQSDPEVIVIDDTVDIEATSLEASLTSVIPQGGCSQLQEGLLMSRHLNSNLNLRPSYTSLQASKNLNQISTDVRTFTYGLNVPRAKEISSELKGVGMNSHGLLHKIP